MIIVQFNFIKIMSRNQQFCRTWSFFSLSNSVTVILDFWDKHKVHLGVRGLWSGNIISVLSNTYWREIKKVTCFACILLKKATQMQVCNMHNGMPVKHMEVRECFLSFGAESFVFQFAIQKYRD